MIRAGPQGALIEINDGPKSDTFSVAANAKEGKGETVLTIDFSVKGGPKDVPGVFKSGLISFPDGNVWPKATGVQGVYLDPQHTEVGGVHARARATCVPMPPDPHSH